MSVKIYGASGASFSSMGAYVSLEAYQSLQAALREALDAWEYAMNRACSKNTMTIYEERIAELRAQFLEDKEPS